MIVDIANISDEDEILEVGAGTGALSQSIIKKNPKNFTVLEKDEKLAKILESKYGDKIDVINEDMLKFSFKKFENSSLIIFGNLPYNISTQILAKWIKIIKLDLFCKKFVLIYCKKQRI